MYTLAFRFFTGLRKNGDINDSVPVIVDSLISGACANMVAVTLNTPIDVIKTRMQKGYDSNALRPSTGKLIIIMWREEGPLSFFKGLTPRLFRLVPGGALQFGMYEQIKRWIS